MTERCPPDAEINYKYNKQLPFLSQKMKKFNAFWGGSGNNIRHS